MFTYLLAVALISIIQVRRPEFHAILNGPNTSHVRYYTLLNCEYFIMQLLFLSLFVIHVCTYVLLSLI